MSAAQSLPTTKFGHLPELIDPLHWAMNPVNLRQPVLEGWPEVEPQLDTLELERVYPRGQRGFLLEYRTEQHCFYAELIGTNAADHYAEASHKLRHMAVRQSDQRYPLHLVKEAGLVLRRPGIDHRLPMLGVLNRPDQAEALLAPQLGRRVRILSSQLLAHRLGRRAVVRLRYLPAPEQPPRSVILKCYKQRSDRPQQIFGWMQALQGGALEPRAAAGGRLRLVSPLHCDVSHNFLLMEDVVGIPLDQLRGQRLAAGVQDAGALLAGLQRARLPPGAGLSPHSSAAELEILSRWVPLTAAVFPSLAPRLHQTWERIERGLSRLLPATPVVCHRDYYDKQLIVADDATLLLDLDTLSLADPALDIGNFLAHMQLLELQQRGQSAPLWRAFHAGLGGERRASAQAISLYRQAALLRIACIHAFWSRWQHLCVPLLGACHD